MRINVPVLLFFALILAFTVAPAHAQEGDGAWGEVVDADGNILYDNLTDLGEAHESVDWMPDLPFIDGQATYHEYLTPSGNLVVLPSATTLFFMAVNPEASGLSQADSYLGNGLGVLETMLAGYISPSDLADLGYSDSADFFQAVIDGQSSIWTLGGLTTINFLTDLLSGSLADQNLYTMILLYTQGACGDAPGGCAELVEALPTPTEIECPAPYIQTGPISISGGSGDGGKIAPPNPVVVGQDKDKRGVDVQVNVHVPPVIYHYFVKIPHQEESCRRDPSGHGGGCSDHPGDPNYKSVVNVWYECEEHTRSYTDRIASVVITINLTQESRQWILTELAQAYPGAHLIHPDFSFSYGGGGASWSKIIPGIQTADPGNYRVNVTARSTGTPVSAPRSASAGIGQFLVELVRVTLIEGQ
ncbi:MAG: hypothetical protein JNM55_21170 [Anaerolineales bacterium]|nr:hypothetical protein [Anaerolineales bacterium]